MIKLGKFEGDAVLNQPSLREFKYQIKKTNLVNFKEMKNSDFSIE